MLAARPGEEVASSRRPSVEPRKITVKGALRASHAMAHAPPLTVIFHDSIGAYRKDGPGLDAARNEAQFAVWNLTTSADHNGTGQQAT